MQLAHNSSGMIVRSESCKIRFWEWVRCTAGGGKKRGKRRGYTLLPSSDDPAWFYIRCAGFLLSTCFTGRMLLPPEDLKRHPGILYSMLRRGNKPRWLPVKRIGFSAVRLLSAALKTMLLHVPWHMILETMTRSEGRKEYFKKRIKLNSQYSYFITILIRVIHLVMREFPQKSCPLFVSNNFIYPIKNSTKTLQKL